jgi:hypothetical protein
MLDVVFGSSGNGVSLVLMWRRRCVDERVVLTKSRRREVNLGRLKNRSRRKRKRKRDC